ncbi:MAG: hypothetical protein M3Q86_11240 [Verrucomicrobiota bacterium]|nr:hypothetical protein [Verrucomicrobiota bacterium]
MQPKKVILRAIGPSLPVAGKLANPALELFGPAGLISANDNWRSGGQEAEIINSMVAPTNDLESAIVATLPAKNAAYTAIVRGADGGAGIGLVRSTTSIAPPIPSWPTSPAAASSRPAMMS